MPLSVACALAPPPVKHSERSPEREFYYLRAVGHWLKRFTPLVALDAKLLQAFTTEALSKLAPQYFGLTLDITGTKRLYGDFEKLLELLHKEFQAALIEVRLAVAPTTGGAWALSRYHRLQVNYVKSIAELNHEIKSLPVEALQISDATALSLRQLGIVSFEQLLTLPRKALFTRFDDELQLQLQELWGERNHKLTFLQAAPKFTLRKEFDYPLENLTATTVVVTKLLERLIQQITSQNYAAGRFLITIELIKNSGGLYHLHKEFALHSTLQNTDKLKEIVPPILEKLTLPGTVQAIGVIALDVQLAAAQQYNLHGEENGVPPEQALNDLLNILTARLGRESLYTLKLHESYWPEESFNYQPLSKADPIDVHPLQHALSKERPPQLFSAPHQIRAIAALPDSPPARIYWKGHELRIEQATGPEIIEAEWWHTHLQTLPGGREYFKVQDHTGQWWWIFRNTKTMHWFVHGVWN